MIITIDNMDKIYGAKRSSIETMALKGYELVDNLFVDSSGFGRDNEPALTANQFETKLKQILAKHGKLTAKITDVGQFQVYVGLFKKTGKNKTKKLANNTYLIEDDDKRSIRLHDTDILVEQNGKITINSGGWQTVTTKDRINKYLPSNYSLNQKDYEWYLNGKTYTEGMQVNGVLNV